MPTAFFPTSSPGLLPLSTPVLISRTLLKSCAILNALGDGGHDHGFDDPAPSWHRFPAHGLVGPGEHYVDAGDQLSVTLQRFDPEFRRFPGAQSCHGI